MNKENRTNNLLSWSRWEKQWILYHMNNNHLSDTGGHPMQATMHPNLYQNFTTRSSHWYSHIASDVDIMHSQLRTPDIMHSSRQSANGVWVHYVPAVRGVAWKNGKVPTYDVTECHIDKPEQLGTRAKGPSSYTQLSDFIFGHIKLLSAHSFMQS